MNMLRGCLFLVIIVHLIKEGLQKIKVQSCETVQLKRTGYISHHCFDGKHFIYYIDVYQGENVSNVHVIEEARNVPTTQNVVMNVIACSDVNNSDGMQEIYMDNDDFAPELFVMLCKNIKSWHMVQFVRIERVETAKWWTYQKHLQEDHHCLSMILFTRLFLANGMITKLYPSFRCLVCWRLFLFNVGWEPMWWTWR